METYLYPTVSIMVIAYILFKAFSILCHTRLFGLWDKIFACRKKPPYSEETLPYMEKLLAEIEAEAEMVQLPEIPQNVTPEVKHELSYRQRFLVNNPIPDRVTTAINREHYETIRRFLRTAAPGIATTSYVNNIIAEHLNRNWKEISELYYSEIKKPLSYEE